jgi:hypothetical protein
MYSPKVITRKALLFVISIFTKGFSTMPFIAPMVLGMSIGTMS